ncbi:hypothetical protein F4823DRAFT_570959 [Ustulina deusta]|nr:hypothetical protein F4823DRAFT_570959 [Ustulina deusta]
MDASKCHDADRQHFRTPFDCGRFCMVVYSYTILKKSLVLLLQSSILSLGSCTRGKMFGIFHYWQCLVIVGMVLIYQCSSTDFLHVCTLDLLLPVGLQQGYIINVC